MGISLKERQITEEPTKVKIWKKSIRYTRDGMGIRVKTK